MSMYKELHIEYSSPTNSCDPLTIQYNLISNPVTEKWLVKLEQSLGNIPIDDPYRFYGFDDKETERQKAINSINKCIDIINDFSPNFITRKIVDIIDQDTLNYLHHIFEVYHGLLDEPHEFFKTAPKEVQWALGNLNVQVHRCEGLVSDERRTQMPTHMVTFYGMNRYDTLDIQDYEYFTDYYEVGTLYLLYVEIGKTLQDLAIDEDHYISDFAYRPFRHYSSDFVVRFFGSSAKGWQTARKLYKNHYDKNKEFYDSKGFNYSHPYNRPGNPPLAKIANYPFDIVTELRPRQYVSKISLV